MPSRLSPATTAHSVPQQPGRAVVAKSSTVPTGPFDTEGRRPQPLEPWATNGGPAPIDNQVAPVSFGGGQSERGSVKDADAGLSPTLSIAATPTAAPCGVQRAENPTGGAGAANASTYPTVICPDCDGNPCFGIGHGSRCDTCDGLGEIDADPFCQCGEPLDDAMWCASCGDYWPPSEGWLAAERAAVRRAA